MCHTSNYLLHKKKTMNLIYTTFILIMLTRSVHLYCGPYNGEICKSYSTGYVWYNDTDGLENEKITSKLWQEMISTLREPCRKEAEKLLCAYAFPKCIEKEDVHNYVLPLCYEDCIAVKMQFCYNDWIKIEQQKQRGIYLESRGHFRFPECEKLPRFSGKGTKVTCNNLGITNMDRSQVTTTCVKGNGRYYQGIVNVTKTGLACQAWESQFPHQHTRPPLIFPEVQNSSNYCRNPGGADRRPWCYTMDPNVRWDYCAIPSCANFREESDSTDSNVISDNYFNIQEYLRNMWWSLTNVVALTSVSDACIPSVTTVSGTHAPLAVCSGALIFEDNFDEFDLEKWQHENTLSGGGNWEFQYYNNNRTNSFTDSGLLYIRPSLTSDQFGEEFITSGILNVEGGTPADRCTNPQWWGCERSGNAFNILNPIKSARIRTVNSFSFRYGRVEVRAKMPVGDWLWPAIWLLPTYSTYGTWPASGEIDLVESRGNKELLRNDVHIGTQQAKSTLRFGPYAELNEWERTQWIRRNSEGYDTAFHRYQMEWTPDHIQFSIDDVELGRVAPDNGGFWEYGDFGSNPNIENPWRYASKMAPFDQKFFLIINLAVGGINGYFPDGAQNPKPKPWWNSSPKAATDFWELKDDWLPTWNLNSNDGKDASLKVDYVRVWAL